MKALLIDHDDSFTFNLRNWLSPLFENIEVINHRDLLKQVSQETYDLIISSPGPKSPAD
ncbi:MAG: glutamine amidotransferase-related protein, partial [Pseudobdellovibrio sp.]